MAAFAADLKARPGSKHAFLFYQREQVPKLNDRALIRGLLNSSNSEMALKAMELMAAYNHDIRIDREAIQRAFSDAATDVHFLYVTRNRRNPQLDVEYSAPSEDIRMAESSNEIYRVFREIAAATGGTAAASANPAALLRQAAEASEEYYLLYYRPQDFGPTASSTRSAVTVKRTGLRVSHREGYVAEDAAAAAAIRRRPGRARRRAGPRAPGLGRWRTVEEIDLCGALAREGRPRPAERPRKRPPATAAISTERRSISSAARTSGSASRPGWWAARPSPSGRPGTGSRSSWPSRTRSAIGSTTTSSPARRAGPPRRGSCSRRTGTPRREERATLQTNRFLHKLVVLGPVGLFGEDAQSRHEYVVAKETEMEGEPVLVVDVRPKGMEASSLYGKAWVRPRDGAVLKIEWEPASMGNYAAIEAFARDMRAKPRIRFTSEYAVEKNGLRFPSSYEVVEAYRTSNQTVTASKTSVAYKDYKFFEVKVRTEVRRGG